MFLAMRSQLAISFFTIKEVTIFQNHLVMLGFALAPMGGRFPGLQLFSSSRSSQKPVPDE